MLPVVASWLLTSLDVARLFFPRYLVAAYVALPIVASLLMQPLMRDPRTGRRAVTLLLLFCVVSVSPARHFRYGWGALLHSPENWRPAIAAIHKQSEITPVILYSGLIEADAWCDSDVEVQREFCEFPVRGLYHIGEYQPVISLPRNNIRLTDRSGVLNKTDKAWLLVRRSG